MNKQFFDLQLDKIKLFKIFSNMDTQSAIVAAIAISVISFLVTGFSNLCNYIYWSAYFNKFNIPLAYIDEALIHENGIKYSAILYIPVLVFVWWLLGTVKTLLKQGSLKIAKKCEGKFFKHNNRYIVNALKYISAIISILLLIAVFVLLSEWDFAQKYRAVFVLYFELAIFILWNISKASLGRKFIISHKTHYTIRIIGTFVLIYLILGYVYYSGSFENYNRNGEQLLQIVNDSEINYYDLDNEEEFNSQLVLFETDDYYYVTDVTITNTNGVTAKIWGTDSYCFIDKTECPVKSVYAHLTYIASRYQEPFINSLFGLYIGVSLIFGIIFIPLLSIPMREEEKAKKAEEQPNSSGTE